MSIILSAARIWSAGEGLRSARKVLVEDGRIMRVDSDISTPHDAQVLELGDCTLMPGLIDAHSHLFLHPYNQTAWDDQVLKESEAFRTVRAVRHAEASLAAGFTTLRDLGTEGAGFADIALKRAIQEGIAMGPRLLVAGPAIVATGSYGPAKAKFRPDCCFPQGAEEASGIDEVVRAVRHQISHGVDWIKVYGDYRTGPDGSVCPTFSIDELKALVATAHDCGRPVASHAMCDEAIRRSIAAGVDTIEHGYGGSEKTFLMMADKGVSLLPTLTASEAIAAYFHGYVPGKTPPTSNMRLAEQGFLRARAAKVRIGCGSDVGVFAHGENARELSWMVRLGMSNEEALTAATATNAAILRRPGEIGRIAPGFVADLIAVRGNPLADIAATRDVCLVMKGGIVAARS